jgi:hypothetical protein
MGQRARIRTSIVGFDGWKVMEAFFESASGARVQPVGGLSLLRETRLVLVIERRWLPRCSQCARPCRAVHEKLPARRWADLPWAHHPVELRYAPVRVRCPRCAAWIGSIPDPSGHRVRHRARPWVRPSGP